MLSSPDKWTQGALARDASGVATGFSADRNPACFCIIGALTRAMHDRIEVVQKLVPKDAHGEVWDQYNTQYDIVYDYLATDAGDDIAEFNDSPNTYYADVINLFDLAIDNAEEKVYE